MGTGEWTPRCSPASSKDSWNKIDLQIVKYRTTNSHNKYKLQAITGVIKWHFMFLPSPGSHQKFKKASEAFWWQKSSKLLRSLLQPRHLAGATSLPLGYNSSAAILPMTGHGLKQGCLPYKLGSKLTRVQARKLERQLFQDSGGYIFVVLKKKCLISQKGNTKGFDILSRPTVNCRKASGRRKWSLNWGRIILAAPELAIRMSFPLMLLISIKV